MTLASEHKKIRQKPMTGGPQRDPVEEFLALPDEEKRRISESYDRPVPDSELRPLTAEERSRWNRIQARLQANAPEAVTVSLQKRLLERADAYGLENGLTRHDVFVLALQQLLMAGVTRPVPRGESGIVEEARPG